MSGVFASSNFNGDISRWDVSNVENLSSMFKDNKVFDQDLNKWNVEKVKQFNCMFENAIKYNHDVSRWNVETVVDIDMTSMFKGAETFKRTICGEKWSEKKWSLDIKSQAITEDAGVIVTQGDVTGKLVRLNLQNSPNIVNQVVIKADNVDAIFVSDVDLVVGSTTIQHATITKVTNNNAFADGNGQAGCCDIGSYMEKPSLAPFNKENACAICPFHLNPNSYTECPRIQDLVQMWMKDEASTNLLYGHIKDWNTSEVTDMKEMLKMKSFVLAAVIDGTKSTWDYDQPIWTDNSVFDGGGEKKTLAFNTMKSNTIRIVFEHGVCKQQFDYTHNLDMTLKEIFGSGEHIGKSPGKYAWTGLGCGDFAEQANW